jgi:hypothetical protein
MEDAPCLEAILDAKGSDRCAGFVAAPIGGTL